MGTNQNLNNVTKINNDLIPENQILDIEGLMNVEGGVDNDEDWCMMQACSVNIRSTEFCYTGS